MIHEVDEVLRAFVKRDALRDADVDVAFEAPTKDWSSRRNAPAVDLYLYDIREDLRRREVGRVDSKGPAGTVAVRHAPPRWFKLSYLLTAWTQRPEDEHRLLSLCLGSFLRHDRLPRELLVGSLRDLGFPLPITIALPPPEDRALSDVWSALGGELKPSLDLVVLAPFDLSREIEAGPPVREGLRLDVEAGVVEVRSRSLRAMSLDEGDEGQDGAGADDGNCDDSDGSGASGRATTVRAGAQRLAAEQVQGGTDEAPGRRIVIRERRRPRSGS